VLAKQKTKINENCDLFKHKTKNMTDLTKLD